MMILLTVFIAFALAAEKWCDTPATESSEAGLPDGWCIRKFATLKCPRTMQLLENGDIIVGSPSETTPGLSPNGIGGIYILSDANKDGKADSVDVLLTADDSTHGIKAVRDKLYYTTINDVWSVPFTPGERDLTKKPKTQVADLSTGGDSDRWTHTLDYHEKTDSLFVTTGRYEGNDCGNPVSDRAGAVLKIGGTSPLIGDIYIKRCRNPMYIRCAPWDCYAMELSGDGWGGQNGVEKMVKVAKDVDIGFPCCVKSGVPASGVSPVPDCSKLTPHIAEFTLQHTPMGFDWDHRKLLPPPYTGGLFVAMHGAFVSWIGAGIQWLPWDYEKNVPASATPKQFIANGWGQSGTFGHRVSDLFMHPDGRMFFSDDNAGAIWWAAPKTLEKTGGSTYSGTNTAAPSTTNSTGGATPQATDSKFSAASSLSLSLSLLSATVLLGFLMF